MDININNSSGVLLLQEVALHPHSIVLQLEEKFEKPSIRFIAKTDNLKSLSKPPIYDSSYLVIFEDLPVFMNSVSLLKLNYMFVVVVCSSKSALESAKEVCRAKNIKYSVFVNEFTKSDATDLIYSLASEAPSQTFCKMLISRVGLNPQRIVSAIMICEQIGYKTSNISKYIDKYVYIDTYDVIESLLGVCKSNAQKRRAALYIYINRSWYSKFTRPILLSEVSILISVFYDLFDGTLTSFTLNDYLDETHLSRYKVIHAMKLIEKVSIEDLIALKAFLSKSSVLEVSMCLS